MQNIVVGTTNTVQTDSSARHLDCDGTGYHREYNVRWQWIALRVVLVLTSLGSRAVVIMQTM